MGTGLQWERFSDLWLAVLKHPDYNVTDKKGRRVFHTSEFETPEGRRSTVYENWSKEKREKFHNDLLHTIAFSQIKCLGASVIASEYDEVASKPAIVVLKDEAVQSERFRLFGNRYFFCAYWAMELAASEAKRYYPKKHTRLLLLRIWWRQLLLPDKPSLHGRVRWKQRYAPIYLNTLGADIHLRYWRTEHLESFFQVGERRTALPESEL